MESKKEISVLLPNHHEEEEEEETQPVTPTGQYFTSSVLTVSIVAVLESEIPIDDSQAMTMLNDVFLPINPRFCSIMVKDENGKKQWKKARVNLEDHVKIPVYPKGLSLESYDEYLHEYLTKISMEKLPESRPLWELYLFKYPTSNAAGTAIFKLHHALGDGYSLMGALFTVLKRADNPSLPITFPSLRPDKKKKSVLELLSVFKNTVTDFAWSLLMSNVVEDHVSPIRSATPDVDLKPFSISTVTFDLNQIKQIKAKLGGTINEVMVGIIFYGTRLYMDAQSKGSGNARSTALVLLNTREITSYKTVEEMAKPDTNGPWGNNFGFLHVSIPNMVDVETADPLEFVFEAKKMITTKKTSLAVYLTGRLLKLMKSLRGAEATASYIRSTIWNTSTAISSLMGPIEKVSLADHPIKGFYVVSVNVPQNLMISMVTYMGEVKVAIGADKELINYKLFNTCVEKAFERIFKAANDQLTS